MKKRELLAQIECLNKNLSRIATELVIANGRIEQLEQKVEELEQRLAIQEARPYYPYVMPAQPHGPITFKDDSATDWHPGDGLRTSSIWRSGDGRCTCGTTVPCDVPGHI